MPHFYFDIVNDHPVHDKRGIRLPDVDAARAHAQKMAGQLARDRELVEAGLKKIVVKDSKFREIISVPLTDRI